MQGKLDIVIMASISTDLYVLGHRKLSDTSLSREHRVSSLFIGWISEIQISMSLLGRVIVNTNV